MLKNKKSTYSFTLIPLVIIVGLFIWLFMVIFEGEKPLIDVEPKPEYISSAQKFKVKISDRNRGLKKLKIAYDQGGREVVLFEKNFPFVGLLNKKGDHYFETDIEINPSRLHLAQGRMDIKAQVWDYSRRGGGDGNMSMAELKMTVDTIPPSIRSISRMHNVNTGGTALVIYKTSSDATESGVYVNDHFSPGFLSELNGEKNVYLAYFAIPHNADRDPNIYLWAKDRAGNVAQSGFYYHVRRKNFRKDKINITDSFLKRILPYFSYYPFDPEDEDIEKFLIINNDIRREDNNKFYGISKNSGPERLWEGTWLRLENAATMSQFADHRTYYYKDKKIDEKYHLGIDLASLANSPIPASNNGKIVFAEKNGIYGLTVVIDHGQGIVSLYGHLSSIQVTMGQIVNKGNIIGVTGSTGLAGGDHLHFSVLVNGVYVNPIEWWDSHWIKDNITSKLELLKEQ